MKYDHKLANYTVLEAKELETNTISIYMDIY